MLSFFPRGVLDEILNLFGSVSEGFPSYSLIKLNKKIKQSEKVCRAHNIGSYDQGQGHNRRAKACHLQIMCQP